MTQRPVELDGLIAEHQRGLAMPRGFYTSQAVYDYDIAQVWNKNWIWVGHECQIPEAGDYFLFDYGQESIIVVRDREGTIRAHLNVCRHRGSRVCTETSGNARVFVCPYHAWTFELTGKLRAGRAMEGVIANYYVEDTGKVVQMDNKIRFHPDNSILIANMDRLILTDMNQPTGILECKATNRFYFKTWNDEIPLNYYLQLQGSLKSCNNPRSSPNLYLLKSYKHYHVHAL